MKTLSQQALIMDYLKRHKTIVPAKMSGSIYRGVMFGSEISRRCRELFKAKKLNKIREGRFMVFFKKNN